MVRKEERSPNQVLQRQRIIEGAKALLLRSGPAGCSSRAIAAETGLGNGLIHYYFGGIQEIVDIAMAELYAEVRRRIVAAAAREPDPVDRLWAVVDEYLTAFGPGHAVLWFDYWVSELRGGEPGRIDEIHQGSTRMLTEILTDAGVPAPEIRARAVYAYVIGLVLIRETSPRDIDQLREELRSICGDVVADR